MKIIVSPFDREVDGKHCLILEAIRYIYILSIKTLQCHFESKQISLHFPSLSDESLRTNLLSFASY